MQFEKLLESCRHELIAYCRHLLWNRSALEDAVQEVVLQAFRARNEFTAGDFKRWVFAVATRTVFNLNRKNRPRPEPPPPEPDVETELGLEEAYDAILKDPRTVPADLDGPLRDGLESLNDTERAVFLMRSICDLKYSEIAGALAIPIGSVMGNLSRARVRLRKMLAERTHAL